MRPPTDALVTLKLPFICFSLILYTLFFLEYLHTRGWTRVGQNWNFVNYSIIGV